MSELIVLRVFLRKATYLTSKIWGDYLWLTIEDSRQNRTYIQKELQKFRGRNSE